MVLPKHELRMRAFAIKQYHKTFEKGITLQDIMTAYLKIRPQEPHFGVPRYELKFTGEGEDCYMFRLYWTDFTPLMHDPWERHY